MTGIFALIGDPVAGSPSPAMHRAAFRAAGLYHDYVAVRAGRADLADSFARLRREALGLNVTIPLKEAIVPLLDHLEGDAVRAASVNTVSFEDGRSVGRSTDGAGFLSALDASGAPPSRRALVLGTGGAARAVVAALASRDASIAVSGRHEDAGFRLASTIDGDVSFVTTVQLPAIVEGADLLVNTTPLGGETYADAMPLPPEVALHPNLTVVDLVIRPRETPLLAAAEAAGCRTVEGVEMLVEQGARSFQIWTGIQAPAAEMRRAALAALAEPAEVTA